MVARSLLPLHTHLIIEIPTDRLLASYFPNPASPSLRMPVPAGHVFLLARLLARLLLCNTNRFVSTVLLEAIPTPA